MSTYSVPWIQNQGSSDQSRHSPSDLDGYRDNSKTILLYQITVSTGDYKKSVRNELYRFVIHVIRTIFNTICLKTEVIFDVTND